MFNEMLFRTDSINLKKLERETNRILYLGIAVSMCFHLVLVLFVTLYSIKKEKITPIQAIPVNIVKRAPRQTRPYILKDRPLKRKFLYKRHSSLRIPGFTLPFSSLTVEDYSPSEIPADIDEALSELNRIADEALEEIEKSIPVEKTIIPSKKQLFTDQGRYKSMVIVPPDNKTAIEGYTHFPVAVGRYLSPPDTLRYSLHNLAQTLNKHTNIYAEPDRQVNLYKPLVYEEIEGARMHIRDTSEKEMYKYSFIYVTDDSDFRLTLAEKFNFGTYLQYGGFVILDNGLHNERTGESLLKMIRDSLWRIIEVLDDPPPYVNHWDFKPLKRDHELFHCFFDFDDEPSIFESEIIGIYYGKRLIGIYVEGYGPSWGDKRNDDRLKMGVNMVVYAITRQKGRYSYYTGKWSLAQQSLLKAW